MRRIVDLTLTLQPGMRGVEFESRYTVAQHGWNGQTLHLYSHCGTHMDAPWHFGVTPKQTIDQIPLDRCMGPAWLVDLPQTQPRELITVEHLGEIKTKAQSGDSLLLRTGWSRHVNDSIYRDELPRISGDLARWCVQRQIRMLGVEPPSVADVHNLDEVSFIHRILLSGDVIIVEGLANLEAITRDKVFFMALPLKIGDGDGSPVRALGIEDDGLS